MSTLSISVEGGNAAGGALDTEVELVHCPTIGNVATGVPNFPKSSCDTRQLEKGTHCSGGCRYVKELRGDDFVVAVAPSKSVSNFVPNNEWMKTLRKFCADGISAEIASTTLGCSVSSVNKWGKVIFKGNAWGRIINKRKLTNKVCSYVEKGLTPTEIAGRVGYGRPTVVRTIKLLQSYGLLQTGESAFIIKAAGSSYSSRPVKMGQIHSLTTMSGTSSRITWE